MEITVYADVLLAVNFLIDYLLLLFCARLSGRRIIRKRLLAGALVGALTSLVIFLPPLSFWPMTLLKAGIEQAAAGGQQFRAELESLFPGQLPVLHGELPAGRDLPGAVAGARNCRRALL